MNNASYGKLSAGLIAAWFAYALTASAFHLFKTDGPPLALGLSVLMPLAVFATWFAASAGFRQFVLSLNPRVVTLVHSWRIAGFSFLVLYSAGLLPGLFALPAGWGDIAIGATAPAAALYLTNFRRRGSFVLWQVLGMFDLVLAVTLGTTTRFIDPHGVGTAVMSVLPTSLIPTFAVPLLIMLHVICIAQAQQWREGEVARPGAQIAARAM